MRPYRWGVGGYGVVQEVVCVALFTDFIVIFVCGGSFLLFWLRYFVQCFHWIKSWGGSSGQLIGSEILGGSRKHWLCFCWGFVPALSSLLTTGVGRLQRYPRCNNGCEFGVLYSVILAAYNWRELFFGKRDFSTPLGPLQTAVTFFVFGIGSSDFYTVRITPGWNAQKWYPCVYFRNRGGGTPSVLNPFWKSWIFRKEHFSKKYTYPTHIPPSPNSPEMDGARLYLSHTKN